jgi:hypothetical protein
MNLDFGFKYKISKNLFTSISYNNILKTFSGQMIKYSFPQKLVFGLGYIFYTTTLNFELKNISYEIDTKAFNENQYRFGLEQQIFDTKNISSFIQVGIDKNEGSTSFILSPGIKVYNPSLEIQYLWAYPVTNIKDYFGNHFIVLKFSFGAQKHRLQIKDYIVQQPQITENVEEKNLLKTTILQQENQIKQLQDTIKNLEKTKQESFVPQPPKTVIVPVEKTVEKIKEQKEEKILPVVQKPKFPLAHKVSSGETLISIAEKYYNNKKYWTKIYSANKDKIIKGVLIVGETIIIPEP